MAVGQQILQEARRFQQVGDRLVDRFHAVPEACEIGGADRRRTLAELGDIAEHVLAAGLRQLAGDEVDRLDAVGAFIDRRNAGVAIEARRPGLLDEAHAAMHLDAERAHRDAGVGGESLGDRRQQIGTFLPVDGCIALAHMRHVDRMGERVAYRARNAGQRLHGEQVALDVGMVDDRRHAVAVIGRRLALAPLIGEGDRLLGGGLCDRHALDADGEARVVHHREHAGKAAIRLADQPADSARRAVPGKPVAVDQRAGRRTVDAELVLEAAAEHVVARADCAIRIDQEFRDQEKRQAARAGRCVRQPRQHQMDDVVGEIVLAIGDEDLGAEDAVAAVAGRLGARLQGIEVGAGLRLGEVHGPHPFARDQFRQVDGLELVAAVLVDRLDGAHGQRRPDAERHRAGIPHFQRGGAEHDGQALAAMLDRPRQRVPAAVDPAPVQRLPAGRRRHGGVLQHRTVCVADPVERGNLLGRETPRLGKDRLDHILGKIAEQPGVERRP